MCYKRRNYAPGQHGQGRKKVTEYGPVKGEAKVRRIYGINEFKWLNTLKWQIR